MGGHAKRHIGNIKDRDTANPTLERKRYAEKELEE
jgi:hypothetical protein